MMSRLPIVISIVALVISLATAWFNALRPARVIGELSYVLVWRLANRPGDVQGETIMAPVYWLRNIGARPAVVTDIRLVFSPPTGPRMVAHPSATIPTEAVDTGFQFNKYDSLRLGALFRSFSLVASEAWTTPYAFTLTTGGLNELVGDVPVALEINSGGSDGWAVVIDDVLNFGRKPFHLQPMISLQETIPIYTQSWNTRRGLR